RLPVSTGARFFAPAEMSFSAFPIARPAFTDEVTDAEARDAARRPISSDPSLISAPPYRSGSQRTGTCAGWCGDPQDPPDHAGADRVGACHPVIREDTGHMPRHLDRRRGGGDRLPRHDDPPGCVGAWEPARPRPDLGPDGDVLPGLPVELRGLPLDPAGVVHDALLDLAGTDQVAGRVS